MKTIIPDWYRLGIALSVLWVLGVVAYVAFESQESEFKQRYFFDSIPAARFHAGTSEDPIPLRSVLRQSTVASTLVIPLVLGWLPVAGCATARWVRKGFKNEERA